MLCNFALNAYEKFGLYPDGKQRGMLINYETLPGIVPKALLSLFRVNLDKRWLEKMQSESKHYSKSRNTIFRFFTGDSKDKETRATSAIQQYAVKILDPTYHKLNTAARKAVTNLQSPLTMNFLQTSNAEWSTLKSLDDIKL
jgi:hypothetical protein